MAITYRNSLLTVTALALACSSAHLFAQTKAHSMASYTTCAVYHRMLAGAYMRERQSPELANIETQKMQEFIARAKRAGQQTSSAEATEQQFLEAWRADLQSMEDQINRNYKNISHLRINYKKPCAALQAAQNEPAN